MAEVVRGDVSRDVVDGYQRLARGKGEPLCEVDADEQGSDETRGIGHGYAVEVGELDISVRERLAGHTENVLAVAARGYLRHNSAVFSVLLYLCGDDRRAYRAAVLNHARGGLVAGALYS